MEHPLRTPRPGSDPAGGRSAYGVTGAHRRSVLRVQSCLARLLLVLVYLYTLLVDLQV